MYFIFLAEERIFKICRMMQNGIFQFLRTASFQHETAIWSFFYSCTFIRSGGKRRATRRTAWQRLSAWTTCRTQLPSSISKTWQGSMGLSWSSSSWGLRANATRFVCPKTLLLAIRFCRVLYSTLVLHAIGFSSSDVNGKDNHLLCFNRTKQI